MTRKTRILPLVGGPFDGDTMQTDIVVPLDGGEHRYSVAADGRAYFQESALPDDRGGER